MRLIAWILIGSAVWIAGIGVFLLFRNGSNKTSTRSDRTTGAESSYSNGVASDKATAARTV